MESKPVPDALWLEERCQRLVFPGKNGFEVQAYVPKRMEDEFTLNQGAFYVPSEEPPLNLYDRFLFFSQETVDMCFASLAKFPECGVPLEPELGSQGLQRQFVKDKGIFTLLLMSKVAPFGLDIFMANTVDICGSNREYWSEFFNTNPLVATEAFRITLLIRYGKGDQLPAYKDVNMYVLWLSRSLRKAVARFKIKEHKATGVPIQHSGHLRHVCMDQLEVFRTKFRFQYAKDESSRAGLEQPPQEGNAKKHLRDKADSGTTEDEFDTRGKMPKMERDSGPSTSAL